MTIENQFLSVNVSLDGGHLTSIYDKKNNRELIYQPNPLSWQGQDIVIFPVIGRLLRGQYQVDGKDYYLDNHGLARYNKFTLKEQSKTSIILEFQYDDNMLTKYPYKFVLNVTYSLFEKELKVEYKVINQDERTIYYYIGAHPAFHLDNKYTNDQCIIDGNRIDFSKSINLERYVLDDSGSTVIKKERYIKTKVIPLNKQLFKETKTLILDSKDIKEITIFQKEGYKFKLLINSPILAIWSDEKFGEYVCLEPWWGINPIISNSLELKEKPLINQLEVGRQKSYYYQIIID